MLNDLPELFAVKDLKKGKHKENSCGAEVVYDVHCLFAEEMKEAPEGTIFYRRFHLHAILSLFDCSDNVLSAERKLSFLTQCFF